MRHLLDLPLAGLPAAYVSYWATRLPNEVSPRVGADRHAPEGSVVNAPLTPNEFDWAIAQLPAALIDGDEEELLDLPDDETDDNRIHNLMMTNWSL